MQRIQTNVKLFFYELDKQLHKPFTVTEIVDNRLVKLVLIFGEF